jgi:hypothetical protein
MSSWSKKCGLVVCLGLSSVAGCTAPVAVTDGGSWDAPTGDRVSTPSPDVALADGGTCVERPTLPYRRARRPDSQAARSRRRASLSAGDLPLISQVILSWSGSTRPRARRRFRRTTTASTAGSVFNGGSAHSGALFCRASTRHNQLPVGRWASDATRRRSRASGSAARRTHSATQSPCVFQWSSVADA